MQPANTGPSPKVFVSYSHDSPAHQERALDFADRLRADGIDAMIDQYVPAPPEGWPRWMDRQIRDADFVLLVCTEMYLRRIEGREDPGKGHGVLWEGHLIYQHIYSAGVANSKFIPVLLEHAAASHVPVPLQAFTSYCVDTLDEYEQLFRRLTNQPRTSLPELGEVRRLPPLSRPGNLASAGRSAGTLGDSTVTHPRRMRPLLAGAGSLILLMLAYAAWRTGEAPPVPKPAIYRVRVIAHDAQKMVVNDVKVTSSMGGEVMKVDGGWQFTIPVEDRMGKTLTVYAEAPTAFLEGNATVQLGGDYNPTVDVQLAPLPGVKVHGIVVDQNQRPVGGARVSIDKYGSEAVTTGSDGTFAVLTNAAQQQNVLFRAVKPGYRPTIEYHQAGDAVTLELKAQ